jgi:hypothetical protein
MIRHEIRYVLHSSVFSVDGYHFAATYIQLLKPTVEHVPNFVANHVPRNTSTSRNWVSLSYTAYETDNETNKRACNILETLNKYLERRYTPDYASALKLRWELNRIAATSPKRV